jgi:hypothetical protein
MIRTKTNKKKRRRDASRSLRAAERIPMMNQKGEFIDSSDYRGWEVEVIVQRDVDSQVTVFMYCIAKDPGAAAQLCNKYFDIWHRPEAFGGRYPDVQDIKKASCYDLGDLKEAWRKIQMDALPKEDMTVHYAGSETLPFVFMAYPSKAIPTQHSGKKQNW